MRSIRRTIVWTAAFAVVFAVGRVWPHHTTIAMGGVSCVALIVSLALMFVWRELRLERIKTKVHFKELVIAALGWSVGVFLGTFLYVVVAGILYRA